MVAQPSSINVSVGLPRSANLPIRSLRLPCYPITSSKAAWYISDSAVPRKASRPRRMYNTVKLLVMLWDTLSCAMFLGQGCLKKVVHTKAISI